MIRMYTDKALSNVQKFTEALCSKLANLQPSEDFTRNDICYTMVYLKALQDIANAEAHRREIERLKNAH